MQRKRSRITTFTTAALLLSTTTFFASADLSAQLKRGHAIATVIQSNVSEVYDIDLEAGTATKLVIPNTLTSTNAILMDTTSANAAGELTRGWVGGNSPADIWEITYSGGAISAAKQLNTSATAGTNVAQFVRIGNDLYFTTQTGTTVGTLQSVPVAGGPVTSRVDLSTVGGVQLFNAVAAIGNIVYCGSFISSAVANSTGELIAYDTTSGKASKVMDIPPGVWQTGWGFGVVNMHWIINRPTRLALFGVYGDYFEIDVNQQKVVVQEFTGSGLGNGGNNAVNSAFWNPVGQDWVMGTRDGNVDFWVGGQSAEQVVTGVGSNATPTANSVTGIYYHPPTAGSDTSVGKGCAGPGGFTATDVSYGAPVPGNRNFKLGLHSGAGGDTFLLSIGVGLLTNPFDLAAAGAPGCFLYFQEVLVLGGGVTGTGNGLGQVKIPVPIPTSVMKGTKAYRQWFLINKAPVNTLGITTSNVRLIDIQ